MSHPQREHRIRPLLVAAIVAAAFAAASAAPFAAASDTSGSVTNATPTISAVVLYTSAPTITGTTCPAGVSSFDPTGGGATTIHVCVAAADDNGYNDICDTGALDTDDARTFDVTTSGDVPFKSAETLACQTGTASGTAVALLGSFTMEFWRLPVSGGTSHKIAASITDVAAASVSHATTTFEWTSLTHITGPASIALGSAAPNAQATEVAANVRNTGNVLFTIHVSGTDLTSTTLGTQTIPVANLKYHKTESTAYGSKTALSGTATSTTLDAAIDTSAAPVDHPIYFQLGIPAATSAWVPSATYEGTVTFATSG